jgi:hypothetical protein
MAKKQPKTKTEQCKKYLPCVLTQEEITAYAIKAVDEMNRAEALDAEAKEEAKYFKERIGRCLANMRQNQYIAKRGKEDREVECERVFDWNDGTVSIVRLDTGEIHDTRPMEKDELQMQLDGTEEDAA